MGAQGKPPVHLADEEDFLQLVVASERVGRWLDTITCGREPQVRQAVLRLAEEVTTQEAYAEEAREAGAVNALTKLLSQSEDEQLLGAAASIIAACGGPLAESGKVQQVQYRQHTVWIREGALGDGLGARIWIAAHILCRLLVDKPATVAGHRVLELGSGCGLCGLLAAKLGAAQVTLTDYEHKVLLNLRACVLGNASASEAVLSQRATAAAAAEVMAAETRPRGPANGTILQQWDTGPTRVRFLDWAEALEAADAASLQPLDSIVGRQRGPDEPPGLPRDEKFPVIIGSDLLYEAFHGALLAAVLKKRLATGGVAIIAMAVRRQAHLDTLLAEVSLWGLAAVVDKAEVDAKDVGIVGREQEYEGGFVIVTVTHDAPCPNERDRPGICSVRLRR